MFVFVLTNCSQTDVLVTMNCTYRSADGYSIWNKKQTSCYFNYPVAIILCIKTVAKRMLLIWYFCYSDGWLEYPQF